MNPFVARFHTLLTLEALGLRDLRERVDVRAILVSHASLLLVRDLMGQCDRDCPYALPAKVT